MKRILTVCIAAALLMSMSACGGSGDNRENNSVDALVSEYGYQWEDTSAPILNETGAKEITFNVYSSKNASALDYNDMKIMQDLYAASTKFSTSSTQSTMA